MSRYEEKFVRMEPAERLKACIHYVLPLSDAFFAYLKSEEGSIAPKSATGKAISYCLNQESYLRIFLTDGYVPMTNNAAERSIRPFTVGRNNWFQIDTVSGAKASAIAYSIAETAKANKLKPYEYFHYLLEELPKHREFGRPFLCRSIASMAGNIRRLLQQFTGIRDIRRTILHTCPTGPAWPVGPGSTSRIKRVYPALTAGIYQAVIEGSAHSACFFFVYMFTYLFGDGSTVFIQKRCDLFKGRTLVKLPLDSDPVI